jgi:hypothetical protein
VVDRHTYQIDARAQMTARLPTSVHLVEVPVATEEIIALAILAHGTQSCAYKPRESLLGAQGNRDHRHE